MATDLEFMEFLADQMAGAGEIALLARIAAVAGAAMPPDFVG